MWEIFLFVLSFATEGHGLWFQFKKIDKVVLSQWNYFEEISRDYDECLYLCSMKDDCTAFNFTSPTICRLGSVENLVLDSQRQSTISVYLKVVNRDFCKGPLYKNYGKYVRGGPYLFYTDDDWIVMQTRGQCGFSSDYFNKLWSQFTFGFGFPGLEYWMGLDQMYFLTNINAMTLRITMTLFDGSNMFAYYKVFQILDQVNYTLHLFGYYGDVVDSFSYGNSQPFSTRDNDIGRFGCPTGYSSGWWFTNCFSANLNGPNYEDKSDIAEARGIVWYSITPFKQPQKQIAQVEMAIKARFEIVRFQFDGNEVATVSCSNGYFLLSCGLDNYQMTNYDAMRQFYPKDETSCACYDKGGAKCVSRCGLISPTIVRKAFKGNETVTCPIRMVVTGCNIKPFTNSTETNRYFYPSSQTTCTCYDSIGATCIAICSLHIEKYSINMATGQNILQIKCPNGSYALGCGYQPTNNFTDQFPSMFVATDTSCECYNHFGAQCFAICGI